MRTTYIINGNKVADEFWLALYPVILSCGSADADTQHFLSFATANAFFTALSGPLSSSLPVASTK